MSGDPNALIGIVDRIGTKLVICNDAQLANLLDSYIPKLLELLNFPNEQVRNKIVSVLSHVNKRIKEQLHISLPFAKILDIYLASVKSSWTTNFALIYLEMSFERHNNKQEWCPILFEKIHQLCQLTLSMDQQKQLDLLLRYFIDALRTIPLKPLDQFAKRDEYSFVFDLFSEKKEEEETEETDSDVKMDSNSSSLQIETQLLQQQKTKQVLLGFFKDCMLLKPNYSFADIPKGLSIISLKRLIGNSQQRLSSQDIIQRQETVFHFLTESGLFEDNEMVTCLLIGATETVDSVAMPCDNAIKKLDINWEDANLIRQLLVLILGDKSVDQSAVSEPLKSKCISLLCKSQLAVQQFFEQMKQILSETLFSEYSSKKLKQVGYQLFVWSISQAKAEIVEPFSKEMTHQLVTNLQQMSQHNTNVEQKESLYLAVGQFAAKFPQHFSEKFSLMEWYLKMLHLESPSLRVTIQQSFHQLLNAFVNPPPQIEQQIIPLFLQIATHAKQSTPHALQSILIACNKLFPFSHLPSRWICLILSNDITHLSIREEALRGISLNQFHRFKAFDAYPFEESLNQYPKFGDAIQYITNQLSNQSSTFLMDHIHTHQHVLEFLTHCIEENAQKVALTDFLQDYCKPEELKQMMVLIRSAWHEKASADLLIQSCQTLLQLLHSAQCKSLLSQSAKEFVTSGMQVLLLGDETSKQLLSQCIALSMSCLVHDPQMPLLLQNWCQSLLQHQTLSHPIFYSYMVVFGYTISLFGVLNQRQILQSIPEIDKVLQLMITLLQTKQHPLLFSSIVLTWRQMAQWNQLSQLYHSTDIKQVILELLIKECKKQTNEKMKEFILQSLGISAKGMIDWCTPVMNLCFEYLDDKSQELQFVIGQTLGDCIGGNANSKQIYDTLLVNHYCTLSKEDIQQRQEWTIQLLQKIIKEGILSPKKIVKQTATIWITVLIEECYPLLSIYKKELAMALAMNLLQGSNNELTQEMAAKGLSLLYDLTTETEAKQELVQEMVDLLSPSQQQSSQQQQQLQEWKLFPKEFSKKQLHIASNLSSEGNSTNYRELVDVAKQLQQPHLLFKLLSYAQQSAAVLALKSSLRKEEDISLSKITPTQLQFMIPKLYRYMYDPSNELLQRTTGQLFRVLLQLHSKQNLDTYFVPIFKELLHLLESNSWRDREAACYGMGDLLSGKKLIQILPWIQELLYRSFKITDDMRDSCRKAAQSFVKKLGELIVRGCSVQYVSQGKEIEESLQQVVPFFLEKGIHFPAKEMVFFSLNMLQQISDASKHFIKPFVADLVSQLLQQMSVLEPSVFNYLQTNPDYAPNIDKDQLDRLRVQMASQSSPIPDILQQCSRQVDASVMEQVVPNLMDTIKNGIGVPTRAQTANFLVNLSKFHPELIKKYAFKLLRAILQAMQQSKSSAERNALSSSMPYLLLKTSQTNAGKIMEQILQLYVQHVNEEQEDLRLSCGTILIGIARHAQSVWQKYLEQIVPLVCVAQFDDSEKVKKVFVELWDMLTDQSSTRQILVLYLEGIMNKGLDLLNQSAWKLKHQGGQAIKHISKEVGEEMPASNRNKALQMVIENIPGRIWSGKESVLESMGYLITCFDSSSKTVSAEEVQLVTRAYQLILKEIKREDWNYKMTAWKMLELMISQPILASIYNQEWYQQFKSAILEALQEKEQTEQKVSNHIKESIRVSCYKSYFKNFSSQQLPSELLWEHFEFLSQCLSDQKITQTEIMTLIECLEIIWKQCRSISDSNIVRRILQASMQLLEFNSNPMNRNLQIREKVTTVWNANWSWMLSQSSGNREELQQWKELVQRTILAEKDFHQKEQLTSLFSRVNQLV